MMSDFEDYIKALEYRRDAWKVLAKGEQQLFPRMARALNEKHDKDMLLALKSVELPCQPPG